MKKLLWVLLIVISVFALAACSLDGIVNFGGVGNNQGSINCDAEKRIDCEAFEDCDALTTIKYRGAEEEWDAIVKEKGWFLGVENCTIIYNYDGE